MSLGGERLRAVLSPELGHCTLIQPAGHDTQRATLWTRAPNNSPRSVRASGPMQRHSVPGRTTVCQGAPQRGAWGPSAGSTVVFLEFSAARNLKQHAGNADSSSVTQATWQRCWVATPQGRGAGWLTQPHTSLPPSGPQNLSVSHFPGFELQIFALFHQRLT